MMLSDGRDKLTSNFQCTCYWSIFEHSSDTSIYQYHDFPHLHKLKRLLRGWNNSATFHLIPLLTRVCKKVPSVHKRKTWLDQNLVQCSATEVSKYNVMYTFGNKVVITQKKETWGEDSRIQMALIYTWLSKAKKHSLGFYRSSTYFCDSKSSAALLFWATVLFNFLFI